MMGLSSLALAFSESASVVLYDVNNEDSLSKFKEDLRIEGGYNRLGFIHTAVLARLAYEKATMDNLPVENVDRESKDPFKNFRQENDIGLIISDDKLNKMMTKGGVKVPLKSLIPPPLETSPLPPMQQKIVFEGVHPKEVAKLSSEVGSLQNKFADLEKNAEYNNLAKEVERLKSGLATVGNNDALAAKVGVLEGRINALNGTSNSKEVSDLAKQLAKLEKEVYEARQLQNKINNQHSARMNQQQAELSELKKAKRDLAEVVRLLKNNLATKVNTGTADKNQYELLSAKVDSMDGDLSKKYSSSASEMEVFNTHLNNIKHEIGELKKNQSGLVQRKEIEGISEGVYTLEQMLKDYESASMALIRQNALNINKIDGRLADEKTERVKLGLLVDALRNELAGLSNSVSDKSQIDGLVARLNALEDLSNLKGKLSDGQVASLTNQLNKLMGEIGKQAEAAHAKWKHLDGKVADLSKQGSSLATDVKSLQAKQKKEGRKSADSAAKVDGRFEAVEGDVKGLIDGSKGVEEHLAKIDGDMSGVKSALDIKNKGSVAYNAALALKKAEAAGGMSLWWLLLILLLIMLIGLGLIKFSRHFSKNYLKKEDYKKQIELVAGPIEKSVLAATTAVTTELAERVKKVEENVTEISDELESVASELRGAKLNKLEFDTKLDKLIEEKKGAFTILTHVGQNDYEVGVEYSHVENGKPHFVISGISGLPVGKTVGLKNVLGTIRRAGEGVVRFTNPHNPESE